MKEPAAHDDVVAAVINYNTASLTLRCVRSLLEAGVSNVLVLDNASAAEDYRHLETGRPGEGVRIIRSEHNHGFAQGCNLLIDEALRDPRCARVLLVNSDAVVDGAGLHACLRRMGEEGHDLMGGRMLKPSDHGERGETVDSLGIALYKCLLASNRMSVEEAYLGPTGGFAVYSRRFLEEVARLHGYVFDPTYFCYAEDTDLAVRARLLGYSAGYADEIVAHHAGQQSTTGEYGDFILYHGIRNSIWMAAKSIPGGVLLTNLPWIVALHVAIVLRHTRQGRVRTLFRLYRDALRGLPATLAGRRVVQGSRRVSNRQFRAFIDPHFYEPTFLRGAVRQLFSRQP